MLFDTVLPLHPQGLWNVHGEFHESIFAKWVLKAHELGMRLDFHLPICTRHVAELRKVVATFIAEEAPKIDLSGVTRPVLKDAAGKWKAFSAMQKAIRRGLFNEAWRSAFALTGAGLGDQMWRRLVVTSMEDIGLADPYAIAFTCWAAGNKKEREQIGAEKVLGFILKALCDAPKSRDLCDAVVFNFLPGTFEKEFAEAATWSEDSLVERAADLSAPMTGRYLAHWRMYGPKFTCTSTPNPKCDSSLSWVLYEKLKLPPLFQYAAYEGYRRSGEALGIPIPFLWQWMSCSTWAATKDDPFEDGKDVMVGGVLACAFDKHTWQGKSAARRFMAGCKPVKEFLFKHCTGDHFAALERAVFYAEGALLRPRMFFEGAEQFYWDVLQAKLASNGIHDLKVGVELYQLVQKNLDYLNVLRAA